MSNLPRRPISIVASPTYQSPNIASTANMMAYKYKPLPNADSFRLLTVAPVHGTKDSIICSLQHAPLGKDIAYTALSYSWGMNEDGDATLSESILVDGRLLKITRNLYQGLQRIFSGYQQQLPIWIDAVCIDQGSIEERNGQVAKMAEIYVNACKLFVWLGEPTECGDGERAATLVDCLRQDAHLPRQEHFITTPDGDTAQLCTSNALMHVQWSDDIVGAPVDEDLKTIHELVRRTFNDTQLIASAQELARLLTAFGSTRYWHRRWVIQEIFHTNHSDAQVLWGSAVIPLAHVAEAMNFCEVNPCWEKLCDILDLKHEDTYVDVPQAARYVDYVLSLQKNLKDEPWHDDVLAYALNLSIDQACSDPRDRVYALLSIDAKTTLRPDYALPAATVYTSFVANLLEDEQRLGGLLHQAVGHYYISYQDEISQALPSWCVDLRKYFFEPHRQQALGPCHIVDLSMLVCSTVVVGRLDDGLELDYRSGRSGSSFPHSMKEPCKLENIWGRGCKAGDSICMFEAFENQPGQAGDTRPRRTAFILQKLDHPVLAHRLVGHCFLNIAKGCWKSQDHHVQTMRIC